jgi:hypothetical protein
VSNVIPWFIFSKYSVLLRRLQEWRRDVRRCFSDFLSNGIPVSPVVNMASFVGFATPGIDFPALCPVSSQGSPALNMASFGNVASTRRLACFFHVVFDGIPTFICAKYAVLCWCRRRFSSVVFSDLRLTCAEYGVFSRRRDNWCCCARRRFVGISRMVSRGFYWRHLQFMVDFATLCVPTLGVDFLTSCSMAFRGSSSLNMPFDGAATIGFPTLGVGLS